MKKVYLILLPILLMIFALPAFAACPSTPSASLGIDNAGSSALAGLIIHTKNNGSSTNWSTTTTANGNGMCDVTSSYGQGTCQTAMTYNTGSNYYIAQQSTACSDTGYLWYGYGSSGAYGNGKALDCKNSSGTDYTFAVKVNVNQPTALGHWDYSASGEKSVVSTANLGSDTDLTSNNNPTVTIKVYNGETAVVTFNWVPHANSAPSISYNSPANNYVYSLSDTIYLNTIATDPNADTVNHKVAYAKSTDGGATWGGWSYGETGLVAQSSTTARTVTSFAASSVGAGYYKWVITVHDAHGTYNAIPAGSPNSYSHNAPRYFTVANPAVACSITDYRAVSGGTTVGAGGTLNIVAGNSVTFYTGSSNASSTSFANGLGNSNTTATYSTAGTYTATYSCSGLYGGSGQSYSIYIQVTPACTANCALNSANYCSGTTYTGNCGQSCTGTKPASCDANSSYCSGTGYTGTCGASCTGTAYCPVYFTLSYNANGGTGAPSNSSVVQNTNGTISSTLPTRSGYTFKGWDLNSGVTTPSYDSGGTIYMDSNKTLFAIWAQIGCSLAGPASPVTKGNAFSLAYATTNASGATINQGVGAVTPVSSGSKGVASTTSTPASVTYTMTANGTRNGSTTCSATVSFEDYVPPVCTISDITVGATPAPANVTGTEYTYNYAGSDITLSFSGTVQNYTPSWSAVGASSTTGGNTNNFTATYKGAGTYSVTLGGSGSNCVGKSIIVKIVDARAACVISTSDEKIKISVSGVNVTKFEASDKQPASATFAANPQNSTSPQYYSKWTLEKKDVSGVYQLVAPDNTGDDDYLAGLKSFVKEFKGEGDFRVTYKGVLVDGYGNYTESCSDLLEFRVDLRPYCKITSEISGRVPMILSAEAALVGAADSSHVFKLYKSGNTNPVFNVTVPSSKLTVEGVAKLEREPIQEAGEYYLKVSRGGGTEVQCNINPITVTGDTGGDQGEF